MYLHYDPYTARKTGVARLPRQRMDFLILLPANVRVVLELDGDQHYADDQHLASPRLYAMVREDRRLRLSGYEVYRFGGWEVTQPDWRSTLISFFADLLERYQTK